eukprot:403347206
MHLIINLNKEMKTITLMDNQSDLGTFVIEQNRKTNLSAQQSYEYNINENLQIQIGDFRIEYQRNIDDIPHVKDESKPKVSFKEDVPMNILDHENDEHQDLLEINGKKNNNNMGFDATLIIPQNPKHNNIRRMPPPVPGFKNNEEKKVDNFSFGDATQIIEPKKMNGFQMPQARKLEQKDIDMDDMFDGATQVIYFNSKNGEQKSTLVEDDMFAETQVLNNPFQKEIDDDYHGATLIVDFPKNKNKPKPQVPAFKDNNAFMNDATQLIDFGNAKFGNKNQDRQDNQVNHANFDATLIIPQAKEKKQENQKSAYAVNQFDATLIIPQGNQVKKPQIGKQQALQPGENFDATLIIPQNSIKNGQKVDQVLEKEEKSDLDRLLNSDDEDNLPRFGKPANPINKKLQKQKNGSINSSMDDLIDALDFSKEKRQEKDMIKPQLVQNKKELDKIVEDNLLEESEESVQHKAQKPGPKFTQDKKVGKEELKKNNKNIGREDPIDNSFDDILEERKDDKKQEAQQSQRYNKKRKAAEISNEEDQVQQDQPIASQSNKKRIVNDDKKQPSARLKNKQSQKVVEESESEQEDDKINIYKPYRTILVSGEAKKQEYKDIIKKLGGKAIEDISENFEVMVTDVKLIRNCKLLQSINLGAKVVSVNWLLESQKNGKFVNITKKHENHDKNFEKTYNCSLNQLYNNKNVGQLLKNQTIYISDKVQGITYDQLVRLIESAGGEVAKEPKRNEKLKNGTIQIMEATADKARIKKIDKDKYQVQSVHFIFDSIIAQKLDFEKNSLV